MHVGLFSYHADGTAAGSAFGTADRLESTVFASGSLCQLGAGYRDLPAMAAHAWKFTGRVVSADAESAVVQLEWQRVMTQGATVTEAPTSVELTLKAGDRVLLDSVAPQTARGCSVTNAGFEARYMARFAGLSHRQRRRSKVEAQVRRESELGLEPEAEPESEPESEPEPEPERERAPRQEVVGVEAGALCTAVELSASARTWIPNR